MMNEQRVRVSEDGQQGDLEGVNFFNWFFALKI
jgi:hypothetical protein